MHVKYASRHALYPVPNVFDAPTPTTVARAALRAVFAVFFLCGVVAVRATDCATALRDVVAALRITAPLRDWVDLEFERAADVAVRETVLVALREEVVALAWPVAADCPRMPTADDVICADCDGDWVRCMLDALRTAASAKPIPQQHAVARSKIFFILVL